MLLEEVNQIQSVIEENASLIDPELKFPCKLCGLGYCGHDLRIYACDHCGNVQIFDFRDSTTPPLWEED
jgi:hypothetical protein